MVAERTLEKLGIVAAQDGWPRIRRWETRERAFEARWTDIRKGYRYPLEAAIRQQDHILEKYGVIQGVGGEIQELEAVIDILDDVNGQLDGWIGLSSSAKEIIRVQLARLQGELRRVVNARKTEARDKIAASRELKDRLGRPNPGAVRASIASAANLIAERLGEEIEEAIVPVIILRKQAMLYEREWMLYRVFDPVERSIGAIMKSVQWRSEEFRPLFLRTQKLAAQVRRLKVKFVPYRDYRNALFQLLVTVQRHLKRGNGVMAERTLTIAKKLAAETSSRLALTPDQVKARLESKAIAQT